MSRFWLVVSIPIAVVAMWLLMKTILHLIRSQRAAVVATVPIRFQQQIVFDTGGSYVLNWDAPLHAERGASINKQLPMNLEYVLSRVNPPYVVRFFFSRSQVHVDSFTRSREQILSFAVPNGGPYTLQINGINPSADYSQYAVIISRPIGFLIVSHVIAILILSFATLGSSMFTVLLIAGKL